MRRTEEGGYDTWGVVFPDGKIREFGTLKKAAMYQQAMTGKDVMMSSGETMKMTGLKVVHRHIPTWVEVTDMAGILNEQEALDHGQGS